MQAAIMYGPNDIRVEDIEKPKCPTNGLILKVLSIGLCGSDIRNMTTDSCKGKYPHIFGHEIVGIVDEIDINTPKYKVGDKYISPDASTQTLLDEVSPYGYYKDQDHWIGIPLWVHRRSDNPMFTISNRISYNDLMVQGKDKANGKAKWYHVEGTASNKYVKEEAEILKKIN